MPAYMISGVTILDQSKIAPYQADVVGIVTRRGGTFRVRGGGVAHYEGTYRPTRLVLVEFDSVAAARACYTSQEYQSILPQRAGAAEVSVLVTEGVTSAAELDAYGTSGVYAFAFVKNPDRALVEVESGWADTADLVERHGGVLLTWGGPIERLEGDYLPDRIGVVHFRSEDDFVAFVRSPEYEAWSKRRHGTADVDLMLAPGVS